MARNRELIAALVGVLLFTPLYIFLARNGAPDSGMPAAHWLGVAGITLMLATETLYSLRKRMHNIRFGRLRDWLSVHIVMGIVGPYLVVLHAAWHYRGLAGIATLLTVLVVLSGFLGRYIYTSIPRTANGVEMQSAQVEAEIAALNRQLQEWLATKSPHLRDMAAEMLSPLRLAVAAGSTCGDVGATGATAPGPVQRGQWRREVAKLDRSEQRQVADLENLLRRQATFRRQLASLGRARRLLATWHTIHVPMGMVLFTAAALHVLAALYFHSLAR